MSPYELAAIGSIQHEARVRIKPTVAVGRPDQGECVRALIGSEVQSRETAFLLSKWPPSRISAAIFSTAVGEKAISFPPK